MIAEADQNFNMYAGETKAIQITITGVESIQAAHWALTNKSNLTKLVEKESGTGGITIVGNVVTIALDPEDTANLGGSYHHECRVEDANGDIETVAVGTVVIYQTAFK